MIRVALRFDDPSPTSDAGLEESLFRVLERTGIPATVAVIPFRRVDQDYVALDAGRASHLNRARGAGTIELALHGYCHDVQPGEHKSEFWGLPAAVQQDKLASGLLQLQSVFGDVVTGFVPPFNSYDEATARSIATLGLKYLSAGWSGSLADGLVFLPRTCQAAELKDAVVEARRFPSLAPIVIAVLHHYDFRESGSEEAHFDLDGFETLLTWLGTQRDVRTLTLATLATELSSAATCATLRRHMRLRHLPWRLRARLPQKCMTIASWPQLLSCALLK